ncbi:hypothetical protein EGW08_010540 [Elysia chlorotica]|uniref:NTF2 domain-containing protein n=1 Tax=Elysia chlorotica TaxID=188477 RepID=A0A3S1B7K3_ELYCH|nr:hypothetical protein EGW08_010540 [Elysia chlorotica]
MLSDQEKINCSDILEMMSDDDIFSLMHTSTNRAVSTKTRKEAISAILQFTQSIDEFFKRRKINKELLLNYIYKQSWAVPRGDLNEIKNYIIRKWDELERKKSGSKIHKTKAVAKWPPNQEEDSPRNPVPTRPVSFTQTNNYNNNKYVHNITINHTVVNVELPTNVSVANKESEEHWNAMTFTKWFYSMLNSHNPDIGQTVKPFGPQHFWRDAQMRLEMATRGEHVSEKFEGAETVAAKLLSFCVSDRLVFSPNDCADGLKSRTDAFGRKVILVCGLVHKDGICVGSFCQSFGLISDPTMNNSHKIRVTLLKLDENGALLTPALTCDNDASVMESLTISAIEFSK